LKLYFLHNFFYFRNRSLAFFCIS